jgi:hypothetical protein
MRAFDNQLSGNRPIQRSRADKLKQLHMLRQQLDILPVRAQDVTRNAIRAKIAELERELGG